MNLIHDPEYSQLAEAFGRFRNDLGYRNGVEEDLVIPTNGATGAIAALVTATRIENANRGRDSKAFVASLEYFDALRMLQMCGFNVDSLRDNGVKYPTEMVIERLKSVLPSLFYVSVPNNPTGLLLPENELHEILEAVGQGTRVIIDRTLVHPEEHCSVPALREKHRDKDIVVVDSLSKSRGMVMDRVGYMIALQKSTARLIHPFAHSPSVAAINRATDLLDDNSISENLLRKIQESDSILQHWNIGQDKAIYHRSNSNFACIELIGMSGSECKRRLKERGIELKSGKDLLVNDKYIRIDMGQPEALDEFLSKLDETLLQ